MVTTGSIWALNQPTSQEKLSHPPRQPNGRRSDFHSLPFLRSPDTGSLLTERNLTLLDSKASPEKLSIETWRKHIPPLSQLVRLRDRAPQESEMSLSQDTQDIQISDPRLDDSSITADPNELPLHQILIKCFEIAPNWLPLICSRTQETLANRVIDELKKIPIEPEHPVSLSDVPRSAEMLELWQKLKPAFFHFFRPNPYIPLELLFVNQFKKQMQDLRFPDLFSAIIDLNEQAPSISVFLLLSYCATIDTTEIYKILNKYDHALFGFSDKILRQIASRLPSSA